MRIVLSTHQREAKIPSAMDVVIRIHGFETFVPHFVQKRADACLSAEWHCGHFRARAVLISVEANSPNA